LLQLRQDFKAAYKHSKRLTTLIDISKAFNQQNPGMNISIKDVDGKLLSIEEFMGKIVSATEAICRYLNKKSDEMADSLLVKVANYQLHLAEAFQRQSSPYNKWISQLKECK
jgi:D-Tyr-tRNAtyr deacylase